MNIELTDKTPVRRTWGSVPPSLYQEVKDYIFDLINKGWIRKASSAYASPMVCVRKKDSSLWLCIDYRALNERTLQSMRPTPIIQDSLDSLGGNRWFSTLKQRKPSGFCKARVYFVHCVHFALGSIWMGTNLTWAIPSSRCISGIYGEDLWRTRRQYLPSIPRWCAWVQQDVRRPSERCPYST